MIREGAEGEEGERRIVRRVVRRGEEGEMSEAELEAMVAEMEAEFAGLEADGERRVALAMTHRAHAAEAAANRVVVINEGEEGSHDIDVRCDGENTVAHQDLGDGRRAMVICHTAIQAHAATGIRAAMAAIAGNEQIPEETREEIMRELEAAIEEMEAAREEIAATHADARRVSFRAAPPRPPRPPAPPRTPLSISFSYDAAPAYQPARMASPITGVSITPAIAEECDKGEAQRLVARVTA